jgi:hypothetical protein
VQGKCAKLPATPVPPQVGYLGLSMLGSWLILRWALKQMDPNKNAKALAKARKKELAKRLGRPVNLDGQYEDVSGRRRPVCICAAAALRRVLPCLPSSVSCPFPTARALPHGACFTQVVAQAVINPAAIDVTLGDVGGLDHIIQDVTRNVITPMRHPELFASNLLRQKRGVLLYGPPGTGARLGGQACGSPGRHADPSCRRGSAPGCTAQQARLELP